MRFPVFGQKQNPVFGQQDKPTGDKETSVTLTPMGRQKAEQFALEGPKFDILAALLDDGTMLVSEIASKTNMSSNKVKEICKSLIASGCLKPLRF